MGRGAATRIPLGGFSPLRNSPTARVQDAPASAAASRTGSIYLRVSTISAVILPQGGSPRGASPQPPHASSGPPSLQRLRRLPASVRASRVGARRSTVSGARRGGCSLPAYPPGRPEDRVHGRQPGRRPSTRLDELAAPCVRRRRPRTAGSSSCRSRSGVQPAGDGDLHSRRPGDRSWVRAGSGRPLNASTQKAPPRRGRGQCPRHFRPGFAKGSLAHDPAANVDGG